ncbi:MAG: PAS domain S-box protein [Deltaproteobacteria bacterium]
MGIPLKLLIIEDSATDVDLVVLKLENNGYDVSSERVEDGPRMWEALQREHWDVIISDHNLPQFDSLRALQVLKDSNLDIPFIIVSGAIGEEVAVRAMRSGAKDYVSKNDLTRLPAAVEREIEDARSRAVSRHTEQLLKESEEKYRLLLEESPDPVFSLTPEGQYKYANRALADAFGKPVVDVIGKTLWEFFPKEEADKRFAAVKEACHNGKTKVIEDPVQTPDGIRYYTTSITPIIGSGKKVVSVICSSKNITERKQAEKVLEDIIDNNPISIQIVDKEGFTINGNPAFTRLFGQLPPPDFSIVADLKSKSPDLEKIIMRAKDGETGYFPDMYYNPHDSSPEAPDHPVWIRAIIFPIGFLGGNPERFVFMHQDITESKQFEQKLENKAREWQETFDAIPDLVSIQDKDHRIIRVNKAYANVFNKQPAELIGKHCYEIVHGTTEPVVGCPQCEVLETGKPYTGELFEPTLSLHLEVCCAPILNNDNEVTGVVHYARNITEHKRLEDILHKSEEHYRSLFDRANDGIFVLSFRANCFRSTNR